jgi:hypothetical protein
MLAVLSSGIIKREGFGMYLFILINRFKFDIIVKNVGVLYEAEKKY